MAVSASSPSSRCGLSSSPLISPSFLTLLCGDSAVAARDGWILRRREPGGGAGRTGDAEDAVSFESFI